MVYVEIETGEFVDGRGIGYSIHHWDVEHDGRKVKYMEYLGEFEQGSGYADIDEAYQAGCERMDRDYGKRNWRHV
jgi:hypothetical protein